MVRPNVPTLGMILALLVAGPRAEAQIAPLTYEVRAGATAPVQELSDPEVGWAGEVGAGTSFGMDFAYTFAPYAAGYAGFSQHRFGCRASACGRDTNLVATGFDAGLRFILGSGRIVPLLRVGGLSYRTEATIPGEGGATQGIASRRSFGFEAGVGFTIGVAPDLVLAPGIRYLRMSPYFEGPGELPMQTIVADVGLMLGF